MSVIHEGKHLVLFGGERAFGCHDDTWVGHVSPGSVRWIEQTRSPHPSGRSGHSCSVVGQHVVLYGGERPRGDIWANDSSYLCDTWVATIDEETGDLTWAEIDCQAAVPPPRAGSAVVLGHDAMLFGGDNLDDEEEWGDNLDDEEELGGNQPPKNDEHQYLDDTWLARLHHSSDSGCALNVEWHLVTSHREHQLGPSPRYGNSVNQHHGRLIIFGGVGSGETFLGDTHMFSLWGFGE